MFLRNHDELTLEMVTDEDRDYMWRTYAKDVQARINLGIRRRLAPLLENHRGRIHLLNGLLFSTRADVRPLSAFDRDRARRAFAGRLLYLLAQRLRRRLVEHVQVAVVADLEDLGRGVDAQAVEIADRQVHHHFHGVNATTGGIE
jgi:hypothetical protein